MSLERALRVLERQERRRLDELRAEVATVGDQLERAAADRAGLDRRWDAEVASGLDMPGGAATAAAYARAIDHERHRLHGLMAMLRDREERFRADLDVARQRRRSLENLSGRVVAAEARDRAERQQRDIDEFAARLRRDGVRIPAPG